MTTQAVQTVKRIASIHRSICFAYEENAVSYPVASIERLAQPDQERQVEHVADPPEVIVYELTWDYDAEPMTVKNALQMNVPESLRRGLTIWNECDLVVQTLLPSLQKQLSASLPGTHVQWLRLDIAPLFVFRQSGAGVVDPFHSAFHITLPEDGGEYVADFTIEQFGYGMERWFLPFEDYMTMALDGSWSFSDYEERAEELEDVFHEEHLWGQRAMLKVCDEIHWAIVERMTESDRTALIDEMTSRALEEERIPRDDRPYA